MCMRLQQDLYHIPLPKTQTHTRKTIPCIHFPSAHDSEQPMALWRKTSASAAMQFPDQLLNYWASKPPGERNEETTGRGKGDLTASVLERCEGGSAWGVGRLIGRQVRWGQVLSISDDHMSSAGGGAGKTNAGRGRDGGCGHGTNRPWRRTFVVRPVVLTDTMLTVVLINKRQPVRLPPRSWAGRHVALRRRGAQEVERVGW